MSRNKVRFFDNERLDKPDASALSTLIYEHVNEFIGAMLGRPQGYVGAGLLTDVECTWSSGYVLSIGKCYIYGNYNNAVPNLTEANGEIFKFDPTSDIQTGFTSVNLAAYQAAGQTPWIFARVVEVDTGLANRRKWDSSAGDETVVAELTRTEKRVEFAVVNSTTPPSTDYFPIFKVLGYSTSGTATSSEIRILSAFDRILEAEAGSGMTHIDDSEIGTGTYGVIQHLYRLRRQVALILDNSGSASWNDFPSDSIADLSSENSAQNTRMDEIEHQAPVGVWASGRITESGGGYSLSATEVNLDSVAKQGTGEVKVYFTNPADLASVALTKLAAHVTATGSTAVICTANIGLDGTGWHVHAYMFDATGSAVDASFNVTVTVETRF
jgi:hypothetical protein